ncbi:gamma-glutamylcyclotransferase family protein [Inmirania thermothiophila]|uniref:Gamma-glutamylcyclotransferase (GGCT)/AIG2-like uncharacterized protein YtfP n=1 Tax=Inmirania thermothiophila TaxID=1750597 RepID=A0A3N1XZX8_9GAMM|nr:gamma-glutamylcyclotransferase family protein [Inmirania thermothiophila]ROR32143.1 gamma-glutamylcyclotransferase (GGCT)/AIG2-like uncharacterized protein YtfP [Inmirania thermothiophila]
MTAHLFVYGTLASGPLPPALRRVLARHARDLGPATVRGRLLDLGPWPGWIPEGAGRVHGRVLALARARWTLPLIDRYEDPAGREFVRVATRARLAHGRELPCLAYAWRGRRRGRPLPSGRWRRP